MEGVRWIQTELLEKYPDLPLRVYVVWFSMVWGDTRQRWDDSLITDPRVLQFWDEMRLAGRWFAENVGSRVCDEGVVWDTFYLYGAQGTWGAAPLLSSGAPVIKHVERLRDVIITIPE